MLDSKFVNCYLINNDDQKFIVFYDHESKDLISGKVFSEEEKNKIIEHLENKHYKPVAVNNSDALIEFTEIMKKKDQNYDLYKATDKMLSEYIDIDNCLELFETQKKWRIV
jgi:hypothetical protein